MAIDKNMKWFWCAEMWKNVEQVIYIKIVVMQAWDEWDCYATGFEKNNDNGSGNKISRKFYVWKINWGLVLYDKGNEYGDFKVESFLDFCRTILRI